MGREIKKFYETFAGSDILAFALFPEAKPILLGQLTTISYSIYREKKPVVVLDRINVAGYTRGPRFIAGSLVFDVYNKSFANDIISKIDYLKDYGPIKADELPLFDILIDFEFSKKKLIEDNGDTLYNTIEQAETENTTNACNKTIQEYIDIWNKADEDFGNAIISKAYSDSKKRKAHHCAEMIRAKSKYFGGSDGAEKNKYSEIEIIQNNVKIYSNKILTKVAETANKGEHYYIFYNAGPISYISTDNNESSEVLYIQNGTFLIL